MSSDEDVSPRKRSRVARKRQEWVDDEEEDVPTSSKKMKQSTKSNSPEPKKKGRKSREKSTPQVEVRVEPTYQEEEDEASESANTEDDNEGSRQQSSSSDDVVEETENARFRLENGTDDDCFEIPLRDDDLLYIGKVGYKITELVDVDEAMTAVEMFEDELQEYRWRCLYERFPAFFSLVRSPSNGARPDVPAAVRSRLVNVLILAYAHMSPHLKKVLGKAANGAPNKKIRAHCRDLSDHLLMLIYLFHKLICIFEEDAKGSKKKPGKKAAGGRGRLKKGKAAVQNDDEMLSGDDELGEGGGGADDESSWEQDRQKVLETLTEIVNLSVINEEGKQCDFALKYLWKGSFAKETLNTLLSCALKFLANPDITRAPSRPVLTGVFRLIRALCRNFRQFNYIGGYLFETLLSLDYYKEGAATGYPFIERIKAVAVNKDMNKLLEGMLEYFRKTTVSVSANNAKTLCLFMTHITEMEPYIVFFGIAPFLGLLSDENASVRSTVLNVLTQLLTQDFLDPTKVPLSERFYNARNNMFDHLLQHVRDVNANVRASALKCLTTMARLGKIPADLIQDGLVQLVGQRISDDKVAVRKEAIRFATAFLQNNPFGHDFDRNVIEKHLKEGMQKRDANRAAAEKTHSPDEAQAVFDSFKDELSAEVRKYCEECALEVFVIPDEQERKDMYAAFIARQEERELGNTGSQTSQPPEADLTMRWLYTMILSEENKIDLKVPARLLVAMAFTNQLKSEHLTQEVLVTEDTEAQVKMIVDAGMRLFVNTACMIIANDPSSVLKKEQDAERFKNSDRALSKDINALVMKLVLEHEFAQCLPAVMSSVMAGEGGDLKLGIDFVVKCKEFNISGSEAAVRQLCGLVWKSDDEGRKQILDAASSMFLSNNANPRLRDAATCENILNLVKSMSDHERGSVEQVLALTTRYNPIPVGVYNLLWEQVDEESVGKQVSAEKKRKQVAAMKALCLLSRSDVDRNRKWLRRYQSIVKEGWPEIAAEALGCIANLASWHRKEEKPVPGKEKEKSRPYRISGKDSLFVTIRQFIIAEMCREEARTWNRSLRATLDIYFHICKDTFDVVAGLVGKMLWLLRRTSQALHYYEQQIGIDQQPSQQRRSEIQAIDPMQREMVAEDRCKYLTRLWSVLVERLCVLTGEVAVRLLVHTDYVFVREFIQARERISKTDPAPFPARPLHAWEENSVLRRGIFDFGSDNAEDVEATGLTEDERIREMARSVIDTRLVHPRSLLGRLVPLVVHSVRAKGSPPRVRFQAMNALSKLMLVSPYLAASGARTFFAFLNNAPSPILRSNLTIAAADLTFRHPNLVENHAASLFAQLQDSDSCVRETCVLILNHLISNDLIKTNVTLSYALLGYIDPVPSIQHLTRGLFHEWSKKEGIMNHVPSFITRIAADSRDLPLEHFRTIMNLFIPLIRERKDADVQALVMKLCARMECTKNAAVIARNPDMPAYFSHCLQLFTLNAKGFHKLVDCLEKYQDCLGDDRVYEDISSMVKVFQKDDLKASGGHSDIADEVTLFLRRLAELHDQHTMEKEVMGKVAKMTFGNQSTVARKVRGRRAIAASAPTPARGRGRKGNKRRVIDSSEDDDDEDSDA
ncbi:hypothetical protein PMAYCL1PPCAC_03958 [Pristionchus mayeri]|uniref:Condensin complex subunit 1 C-terminal domain-containing protein n=1 Tax=Pristionchus mayeri TaxID=1317129 RepID=A0AAN4Z857_9BILA|nr:hypothetical protein PMAYCL1PPCAC_03958 [Pristionchus mayeri]